MGTARQSGVTRFWLTLTHGGAVNAYALGLGAGTILLVLALRRAVRAYRLPQIEMLTALVAASAVAAWFGWSLPSAHGNAAVATVGAIPATLPAFHLPQIEWSWLGHLSGSALAVAILGLMEALVVAKSIARQTGQRLDYNRQCFAEGIANLTGGFFQCLPGSGSLTRSAVNFQAGAASRFSGVVAAGAVAMVLLLAAPLACLIPKPALAGLLLIIAARLVDWPRVGLALRSRWQDAALVLVTAGTALLWDVEYSILIGTGLSLFRFLSCPCARFLPATKRDNAAVRLIDL